MQGQLIDHLRRTLAFDARGLGRTGGERMLVTNDAAEAAPLGYFDITYARDPLPPDFEVEPKPEHFVERKVRMLNQAVIGGWLDFSEEGVLEAAVGLAAPRNLTRNHSDDVEDFIGSVLSAEWGGPTEKTPFNGIDGLCQFDRMVAPRIVRGLNTGTISRFSVVIDYRFRRSHPEESDDWWWDHLGEERDGEIVRLIVVEVEQIYNLGVVWWGRDDYAVLLSRHGRASRGVTTGAPPPDRNQEDEMKTLAELAAENPTAQQEYDDLVAAKAAGAGLKREKEDLAKFRADELAAARDQALTLLEALHTEEVPKDNAEAEEIKFAHENGRLDYLRALGQRLRDRLDRELPQHCPHCGEALKASELSRRQTEPSDPEGNRKPAKAKDTGRSRRTKRLGKTLGGE